MNPLSKKLGLKPGMRALVVAAPSAYLKSLAPLPESVVISEAMGGTHEFVQFFATRRSDIEKSAKKLLKSAAPGALVWITYPKKTSGRRERPQSGGSLGGNGGDWVASRFPDCHRRSLVGAAFSTNRGR